MAIDENVLFREATIRICGDLDLGAALHQTLGYLQQFLPLDRIELRVYERDLGAFRTLLEVTPEGHRAEEAIDRMVFFSPEHRLILESGLDGGRDVEVTLFNHPRHPPEELPVKLTDEEREQLLAAMGMLGRSMIIVADRESMGGLFFSAEGYDRFTEQHKRILELLKEPLIIAISNAMRHDEVVRFRDRLALDKQDLQRELARRSSERIVGAESGLREVLALAASVAAQTSPVLLLGETGTGKELVAHAIHRASDRADGPMVTVNCGAIPDTLLDSELFGHEKGAFTGALESRRGHFERADGGTIFLDEIGELPHAAQVKLLRVLQSKEFQRVGGTDTRTTDVRVIAATHRNLESMVADGRFREDLWFRISVFPIRIPPLRERRDDIPALVHHFIAAKAREMNLGERPQLAPGAIDDLVAYEWPGNVRELQNVIERALIVGRGESLRFDALGRPVSPRTPDAPLGADGRLATLAEVNAAHIRRALDACQGKIAGRGGAAELLDINANTLRARMRKLGVAFGRPA